jgi:hypothetical protein
MAAEGYRAKSATFGSAIANILSMNDNISGKPVDLNADASSNVQAVFLDALAVDVDIEVSDFAAASLVPGATAASLIITYEHRAPGSAAAGSGNKVLTVASCVLVANKGNAGTDGTGTRTLTFRGPGPGSWA